MAAAYKIWPVNHRAETGAIMMKTKPAKHPANSPRPSARNNRRMPSTASNVCAQTNRKRLRSN